jgi:hypothetical protein
MGCCMAKERGSIDDPVLEYDPRHEYSSIWSYLRREFVWDIPEGPVYTADYHKIWAHILTHPIPNEWIDEFHRICRFRLWGSMDDIDARISYNQVYNTRLTMAEFRAMLDKMM